MGSENKYCSRTPKSRMQPGDAHSCPCSPSFPSFLSFRSPPPPHSPPSFPFCSLLLPLRLLHSLNYVSLPLGPGSEEQVPPDPDVISEPAEYRESGLPDRCNPTLPRGQLQSRQAKLGAHSSFHQQTTTDGKDHWDAHCKLRNKRRNTKRLSTTSCFLINGKHCWNIINQTQKREGRTIGREKQ